MCCTSFDRQCRQRHVRKSVQSRAIDADAVMVGAASNGGGGDGGDELSCCRPCGGGGGGGFGVGDGDECSCCRTCPLLRRWRQLQHRAHTHKDACALTNSSCGGRRWIRVWSRAVLHERRQAVAVVLLVEREVL